MYCCYLYFDPRPDKLEYIYVGKGLVGRHLVHLKKGSHNKKFDRKLNKIKDLSLIPLITKIDCLTNNQASMLERFWIQTIGREDLLLGSLCNYTDGGEGSVGYKHKQESIEKWKLSHAGYQATESTKKRISDSKLGWKPSHSTIENMKTAAKLRNTDPEFRAKISKTLTGKCIGIPKSKITCQRMSESANKRSKEHYEKIQLSRLKTLAEKKANQQNIEEKCSLQIF